MPGFLGGITIVQREVGWTLLHSPALSLRPQRPVTEPIAPDIYFFLVLAVNLCVLYRASQAPLCPFWRKNLGSALLAGNESGKLGWGLAMWLSW